jgi:hypothetical protein
MNHPKLTISKIIVRKLAVILLIVLSAAASFATLGDGKSGKSSSPKTSLLSSRTIKSGSFSLRSGYSYRGNQVFNTHQESQYINFNTTVTFQKGNATYIVPLKKKVILNNVKIQLGNQQLRRN